MSKKGLLFDVLNEGAKTSQDSVKSVSDLIKESAFPEVYQDEDATRDEQVSHQGIVSDIDKQAAQERARQIQEQSQQEIQDKQEFAELGPLQQLGRGIKSSFQGGMVAGHHSASAEVFRDGNWVDMVTTTPGEIRAKVYGGIAKLLSSNEKTQEAIKAITNPFAVAMGGPMATLRNYLKEETKEYNDEAYKHNVQKAQEAKAKAAEAGRGGHGLAFDAGAVIPNTAELAGVIAGSYFFPPAASYLSNAYMGKMAWTSFGGGIDAYDEYKTSIGEDPFENETARLGVGLAWAGSEVLAERFLQGVTRYMPEAKKVGLDGELGKYLNKKLLGSRAGQEAFESAAERFAREQPKMWEKVVSSAINTTDRAFGEVVEENVTEVAQFFIDNYFIREIEDRDGLKELGEGMWGAAKGAVLMSVFLGPVTGGTNTHARMSRRNRNGLAIGITKEGQAFEIVGEENGKIVGETAMGERVDIDPAEIVDQAYITNDEYQGYVNATHSAAEKGAIDALSQVRNRQTGEIEIVELLDNTQGYMVEQNERDAVVVVEGEDGPKRQIVPASKIAKHATLNYEEAKAAKAQELSQVIDQGVEQAESEVGSANSDQGARTLSPGQMIEFDGRIGVLSIEPDGTHIMDSEDGSFVIPEDALSKVRNATVIAAAGNEFIAVETENGLEVQQEFTSKEEAAAMATVLDQAYQGKRTFRIVELDAEDKNKQNTFQLIGGEYQAPEGPAPDIPGQGPVATPTSAPTDVATSVQQELGAQPEGAVQADGQGTPSYKVDGRDVSRGFIKAKIRAAKTRADLNGVEVNNDPDVEQAMTDKFPEGVYSFDGDALTREEAAELIEGAQDLTDLEGLSIDNDPELEAAVVAKFGDQSTPAAPESPAPAESKSPKPEQDVPTIKLKQRKRRERFFYKPTSRIGKLLAIGEEPQSLRQAIIMHILTHGVHPDLFAREISKSNAERKQRIGLMNRSTHNEMDKVQEALNSAYPEFAHIDHYQFTTEYLDVIHSLPTIGKLGDALEALLSEQIAEASGEMSPEEQAYLDQAKWESEQKDLADQYWGAMPDEEGQELLNLENQYNQIIADETEQSGRRRTEESGDGPVQEQDDAQAPSGSRGDGGADVSISGRGVAPEQGGQPVSGDGQVLPGDTRQAYGEGNKLVSKSRYEELREKMRRKGGQLNAGFDPEMFSMGAEMAAYHIEAGARKFRDFAKAMIDDLGEWVKPYLKSFYMGARNFPGMEQHAAEMDSQDVLDATDLSKIHGQDAQPETVLNNIQANKEIDQAGSQADQSPTDAQKEAGNYKKGHVKVQGLDITIENAKGSKRSGKDADGNAWEVTLNNHYGYFKRTEGKDGDQVDLFIGDQPTSQKVFIIDQVDPVTGMFDEHKVMLGFSTKEEAISNYNANYTEGWQGAGAVTEMSIDQFKEWLGDAKRTNRPVSFTPEKEAAVEKHFDNLENQDDAQSQSELTQNQQAELEQTTKDLDEAISRKEAEIKAAKATLEKETAKAKERSGLFGDTAGGGLFAGQFVLNQETLNKAVAPFSEAVDKAEAELTELKDRKAKLRDEISSQPDMFAQLTQGPENTNLDKNNDDVSNRTGSGESNSQGEQSQTPADGAVVQGERGRGEQNRGESAPVDTRSNREQGGGQSVPGSGSRLFGEAGNQSVSPESPGRSAGITGDFDGRGSSVDSTTGNNDGGKRVDGAVKAGPNASGESFKERTARAIKLQKEAEPIPVKLMDEANIAETLPLLLDEQRSDVLKAEKRFFGEESKKSNEWANGKGVLFTNGTGTGKTFTGLGIIKRFMKNGAKRVLLVVPASKTLDWQEDAAKINLQGRVLQNTKDSGDGLLITSIENFRANEELTKEAFDLVVYDESHKLMEDKNGRESLTTRAHFRISNRSVEDALNRIKSAHPVWKEDREVQQRLIGLWKGVTDDTMDSRIAEIKEEEAALKARADELNSQMKELLPALKEQAQKDYERTKVVFLSATPFKSVFNLRYAKGILFDWGTEETTRAASMGMSRVDPESNFFLENFGAQFEWKYHQLQTRSDRNDEAVAMQEVQFSEKMTSAGVLSGRSIESNMDYGRDFPIVATSEKFNSEAFNQAYSDIFDYSTNSFSGLRDAAIEVFSSYHEATLLFEVLTTSMSLERIEEHLKMGRKVAVYHRRQNGVSQPPFATILSRVRAGAQDVLANSNDTSEKDAAREALNQAAAFEEKHKALLEFEQTLNYNPAPVQIKERFGDRVAVFTEGNKKERAKMVADFNTDGSGIDILVVQEQSGKEGISLHDTTGKHPRVIMQMSKPNSSIAALQIEGRIYRIGQESNAIFEYPVLGLDMELAYYGSNLNKRLSTTENLAMGNQSRDLIRSFSEGITFNATDAKPSDQQGIGGKDFDKREQSSQTPFQKAKLVYATNQKQRGSRNNREGVDFYATPEPVGQKMMEWANVRVAEDVLEPSAGNGAIAMWAPKHASVTAIEPSYNLFAKMSVRTGELKKKTINDTFENLHSVNKFDSVVMNPPFGVGGKTAMDHLEKAFMHLRETGRVVALIPRGKMDSRLDNFLYGKNDKGELLNPNAHLVASIDLPGVTFQQAGTSVNSRIVIIDKVAPDTEGLQPVVNMDLTDAKTVDELFDRIENVSIPGKVAKTKQAEIEVAKPEFAGQVIDQYSQDELSYLEQKHSRTGATRHTVVLSRKVDPDRFNELRSMAKGLGGFYNGWNKGGARAGFEFKTEDAAKEFEAMAKGGVAEDRKGSYKTLMGDDIAYQLAFNFDQKAQPADDKPQDRPSIRRLEPGEFSTVESKYTVDKHFVFNGTNKVESVEDVAFIFRQLETKAVENMFLTLVDENGKPTIIHLGMGSRAGVVVDFHAIADAVHRFKPKKIYLTHNHPSGNLQYSEADVRVHKKVMDAFGDIVGEHIIINTTSGKYATFKYGPADHQILDRPTEAANVKDFKVLAFDKNVFKEGYNQIGQVRGPNDVSAFISGQRFSKAKKISALILSRSNQINAYVHLSAQDIKTEKGARAVAEELQAYVSRFGGAGVIIVSNDPSVTEHSMAPVANILNYTDTGVLDVVRVHPSWFKDVDASEPESGYVTAAQKAIADKKAEENDLRYKRGKPRVYSPTERALTRVKQEKAAPDQMKAMLLKNGAKEVELSWMGWNGFVEGRKSISKAEVQSWIEENKVQLEEVEEGIVPDTNEYSIREDGDVFDVMTNGEYAGQSYGTREEAEAFIRSKQASVTNNTRYGEYVLMGGNNYREVLLTMKPSRRDNTNTDVEFEKVDGVWIAKSDGKIIGRSKNISELRAQVGADAPMQSKNYKSKHWEEENVVVHVRAQDFTDKDGRKILLIEEVQSDWAQQGREHGFAETSAEKRQKELLYKDELTASELSELSELYSEVGISPKILDMPFKQTNQWVGLALKRMMQEASEGGYDMIGWTTGQTQADRFDLSQHVSLISLAKTKEGTYRLAMEDSRGFEIDGYKGGGMELRAEEVENHVGKEYAKALIEGADRNFGKPWPKESKVNPEYHTINTKDFKVGGEGMKAFYDKILPATAKKVYGKQAKVGTTEITTNKWGDGGVLESNQTQVHAIELTQEMKDAGAEEQAMFKKDVAANPPATAQEYLDRKAKVKASFDKYKAVATKTKEASKKYGTTIATVRKINELPDHIMKKVHPDDYSEVQALYDPQTGMVFLVSDNLDPAMADKVIMHEVLAHKGLREVMGKDFWPILDEVYNSIPEADRKAIAELYGTDNKRVIADEYIAQLAEGYKRPNMLNRVVAKVRDLLRQKFGLNYSRADIMYLLSKSEDYYIMKAEPNPADFSTAAEYLDAAAQWNREGVRRKMVPQHETQSFKEWFGSSKIVDESGQPQVYFHATGEDFNSFEPNTKGLIFASPDAKWAQGGFMPMDPDKGTSGSVMPVYVKAENPFDYRNKEAVEELISKLDVRDGIKEHIRNGNPWGLERKPVVAVMKELGYDGFFVTEEGVTNIAVFQPNQMKSATGNNGGFDPNNDDVRYRRKKQAPDEDVPADLSRTGDKLREKVQDRMISVKRIQQEVANRAGIDRIEWWMDAYEQENRSHGRTLHATERMHKDYVDPLIKAAYDLAGSESPEALSKLQRYLKAKHAPERNRVISKRKELDEIENQSGFTDAEAEIIVNEYEAGRDQEKIDRLWEKVRALTSFTLDKWLEDGFISEAQYNEMKSGPDAYQYYVPLRGHADESESVFEYQNNNSGKSINPFRAAKGRESESDDPIQYMANMAQTAIVMGENNRVKQYAYRMAVNHPNPDLYHIKKAYYVSTGITDKNGKEVYTVTYERPDQELWDEGKVVVRYNNKRMAIDKHMNEEHEIEVMVGGERIKLVFENPEVGNAINKNNVAVFSGQNWLDALARAGGNTTRLITANFTAKNPGFIVPNTVRDVAYAWLSHAIKGGGKEAADFAVSLRKANKAMSDYSKWEKAKKEYENATDKSAKDAARKRMDKYDTEARKLMEEFMSNGAATGYVYIKDVDTLGEEIDRAMKRLGRAEKGNKIVFNSDGYIRVWHKTGEVLEALAQRSENMSRLATYIVARNKGVSAADAATQAKNVTVNFNRKGSQSNIFGSFYAFLNASIQGGENIARMAKENTGKFILGASMLYSWGFLTALLSHLNDDDEEKENKYKNLNDYTKQNHFTIRYGKSRYISIPLPHGWRMFYGLGVSTMENLFLDEEKKSKFNWAREDRAWDKLAFDFADRTIDAVSSVNPTTAFDGGELTVQGAVRVLSPTVVTPWTDLLVNKDFAGREIARKPYTKQQEQFDANAGQFRNNVNPILKRMTDKLYVWGGGDLETYTRKIVKDGELQDINRMFDYNPSNLEHIITYYTGGRGRFFNDLYKTTSSVVEGMANIARSHPEPFEAFDANDIPVVNRFNRQAYDYDDFNWYYNLRSDVALHKYNRSRMSIERQVENINPRMEMLDDMIKDIDKKLKELRQLRNNPAILSNPEQIIEIKKTEKQLIKEFRKAIKDIQK